VQNVLSFIGHLQYYLPLTGILWHLFFLPNDFFQLSAIGVFFLDLISSTATSSHNGG